MRKPRIIEIASAKNPRVKDAMRLRQNRHRKQSGKTLVDGLRECLRALASSVEIDQLFVDRSEQDDDSVREIVDAATERGATICLVEPAVMQRLAFGHRASPCVATARIPHRPLASLELPDDACIAIVEQVEKPGNLGAILRSADGAGVAAVIAADPRTELYQPNVIRASLGTIFTLPVCSATTAEVQTWLATRPFQIVAACVGSSRPYYEIDFRRPTALVLGSEDRGLSSSWSAMAHTVRLPMHGISDSLNVAATAAVLFYEVLRQRELGKLGRL